LSTAASTRLTKKLATDATFDSFSLRAARRVEVRVVDPTVPLERDEQGYVHVEASVTSCSRAASPSTVPGTLHDDRSLKPGVEAPRLTQRTASIETWRRRYLQAHKPSAPAVRSSTAHGT